MISTDILVVGGGLSGLAAARSLQASSAKYILLERCPVLGGLTRTSEVGDFCFDYTGHFLHLQRYASPAAIPFAGLHDDDWISVGRHASCYVADRMITAPFQYHLAELPPLVLEECIRSYDERPRLNKTSAASFMEYLVCGFGGAIADIFLIPQNEKTLAISLDRLSMNAVKRFFPVADEAAIKQGIKGEPSAISGYNASFWYPRVGGIELLSRGLSNGLERYYLNQEVCTVDLDRRRVRTRGGLEICWDSLLTSVPLPFFCFLTGDPELIQAAKQLTHSTTICVNIGLRGEVALPLRDQHWIYVPDRKIPFYRVGVYSNISAGSCASGHSAIYAEVGIPAEHLSASDLFALQENVINALEILGWLDRRKVECILTHTLCCAYVHHTSEAETAVGQIFARLARDGVWPIGRYGCWDYISMEDSIINGIFVATGVLS